MLGLKRGPCPPLIPGCPELDPAWYVYAIYFRICDLAVSLGRVVNGVFAKHKHHPESACTVELDEELESISLMDEDLEVLPLEPMLAPSRAPPPFGEGAIL